MTAIYVPGLLTFTIAIFVFFAGAGLNRLIGPLRRWNIPEPVTVGLLAALATLLAYVVLGIEISFTLDARDMLLLYFFTGIGLNARLDDLSPPSSARRASAPSVSPALPLRAPASFLRGRAARNRQQHLALV